MGSRYSDRAHYNKFVENGSGSWALIRRRLVLRGKNVQNRTAQRSQGEGNPRSRTRIPNSSCIPRAFLLFLGPFLFSSPPFSVRSPLSYILLPHSSSSYTCRSSIPILECTSHRPLFLALCELLWPLSRCLGVTSTSTGLEC